VRSDPARALGLPWSRRAQRQQASAVRPVGWDRSDRTCFAADKTGLHCCNTLFQTSLKYPRQSGTTMVRNAAAVENGAARALTGDRLSHRPCSARLRKASSSAPGVFGRSFPFTTNARVSTTGRLFGRRVIAPAYPKDLEFVQYHPTGLAVTGSSSRKCGVAARAASSQQVRRRYLPRGLTTSGTRSTSRTSGTRTAHDGAGPPR